MNYNEPSFTLSYLAIGFLILAISNHRNKMGIYLGLAGTIALIFSCLL